MNDFGGISVSQTHLVYNGENIQGGGEHIGHLILTMLRLGLHGKGSIPATKIVMDS